MTNVGYLGRNSQGYRIYSIYDNGATLTSTGGGIGRCSELYAIEVKEINMKNYATACAFDDNGKPTRATSCADGKEYDVYEVKDGMITIKDRTYPIKLADGYWIIRKLTVKECARLQTVPEWYDFSCISNSQAYKCLGNGWTVEVIKHLMKSAMEDINNV